MAASKPQTWLEALDQQLNIDIDWMDPDYTQSLPLRLHDQTSNQIFVDIQLAHPSNRDMFIKTARELKERSWVEIYTRMAVLMCKRNIANINGRVLLQTLPSESYNYEVTLAHARLYDNEFARVGISRDRFCIKIPSTGPALNALKVLSDEGIPTLGTAMFGLQQAIACSQAGALYVSPYFNELRAHFEPELRPDVKDDPARYHPMSSRVLKIIETYKQLYRQTGKEQPLVKLASFLTPHEAMASAEMGCHSGTFSPAILDELAKLPYDGSKQPGASCPKPQHVYLDTRPVPDRLKELAHTDPLTASKWDDAVAYTDVDYLANGGEELDKANAADPITKQRLEDALKCFVEAELRSKAQVEEILKLI